MPAEIRRKVFLFSRNTNGLKLNVPTLFRQTPPKVNESKSEIKYYSSAEKNSSTFQTYWKWQGAPVNDAWNTSMENLLLHNQNISHRPFASFSAFFAYFLLLFNFSSTRCYHPLSVRYSAHRFRCPLHFSNGVRWMSRLNARKITVSKKSINGREWLPFVTHALSKWSHCQVVFY